MKKTLLSLFTILASTAFAQTMADAQKAYVAGNWKEAADAYDRKAKELFGEYAWLNNYEGEET